MMLCTMPEKSAGWRYPIRSHLNSYNAFSSSNPPHQYHNFNFVKIVKTFPPFNNRCHRVFNMFHSTSPLQNKSFHISMLQHSLTPEHHLLSEGYRGTAFLQQSHGTYLSEYVTLPPTVQCDSCTVGEGGGRRSVVNDFLC